MKNAAFLNDRASTLFEIDQHKKSLQGVAPTVGPICSFLVGDFYTYWLFGILSRLKILLKWVVAAGSTQAFYVFLLLTTQRLQMSLSSMLHK
jgi:hypothetical protein